MVKDSNYPKIKKLLENLNNSDDYKSIIDLSTNPITITSFNGLYQEVNQKYIDLVAYSRKEIIENSSIDLSLWLAVKDRYKFISEIKKNGFIRSLKINLISKSGKMWKGMLSADIVNLKGKKFILAITEDILEVKESKKALIEILTQEKELADIVRKAPMAIFIREVDGEISNFNKATSKLLAYSEEELSSVTWIDLIPSKWHKYEEEKLNELFNGQKTVTYEIEYIKKDASIIPVELVVSGIFDKKTKLSKLISFATDITKRKEMEKAVNNSQLLQAVGEMASSVAHDFNNSLQIIIGNIELLQELPEITTEIRDYIDTITLSVNDATERVKLLQRLGEKKQINTDFSFILIEDLLNEVIVQTRPLWKDKKQKIGIKVGIEKFYEDGIKILGNLAELRTAFYNIIKNSIEALVDGGTIRIKTQKVRNQVLIKISDNGIGMSEETILNIFQPFYSTKGFGLGRGLGMSGAYSIIKEHKGLISLDSELGKGSSITVKLPYNEFEFEDKEEEFVERYLKKLRILWVDDEIMLQKLGKKILTKLGHKADLASDGLDALNILSTGKVYDLIITDIGMPNMNGWQLIKKIREKFDKNIKIIVLTGWSGEISRDEQNNYNIDGILGKPIRIEELKNCISKAMNKTL